MTTTALSAADENYDFATRALGLRIRSTMTPDDRPVLSAEQIALLTQALETIQPRFKVVYEAQDDDGFAIDVEFKFGAGGGLVVKQARPWVD